MLAVAAICLVAALVGAPTAGAASAGNATAKSAQKAKAAVTKKALARSIAAVRRRANTNRRNINRLRTSLSTLETSLRSAITGGDKTIDDKINGIVAAVTPILGQIGGGLQELATKTTDGFATVADALTQLKTGLETAGAGLVSLRDFTQAVEYGALAFYTFAPGDDPTADAPNGRSIAVISPDIPDSGNTTTAAGEFPVSVVPAGAAPPNSVSPGAKIVLGTSIKSNEADGLATGDPAGQVGALLTVVCGGGASAGDPCGDGGGPQPDFAAGQIMCVVGPTKSNSFPTPAGPINQFLTNIQEKVSFVDPTQPAVGTPAATGSLVNPLIDAVNDAGTGDASEGSCALTSFGAAIVKMQTQFVDIPTSATPGPKD